MPSVDIIAELLAATASADTPRSLVRAIAGVLSRHAAVQVVALEDTNVTDAGAGEPTRRAGQQRVARSRVAPLAVTEKVDGEWRIVDRAARPTTPIVPGLAVA